MTYRIRNSLRSEEVNHITHLINWAYEQTEGIMFEPGYTRTSKSEVKKLAQKGQLLLAEDENEIMGAVKVGKKEADRATFGMLAVSDKHWGKGVGKVLVEACENWAKEQQCSLLEIEILRSHHIMMPHKDRLYTWYEKMGYFFQKEIPVKEMYPDIVPQIIQEGVIQVFVKELTGVRSIQGGRE